jgi:hypothetical protein
MKTILKNARTGLYFQGISEWTGRAERAFDFQRPERLVRFIRAAELDPGDMELVFAFDNPRHNLCLAIDERFGIRKRKTKPRRDLRLSPLASLLIRPPRVPPVPGRAMSCSYAVGIL